MIVVKLQEAMLWHRRQTGARMSYRELAARTGLSAATLQSIATRPGYNPTLDTIDRIAEALGCPLEALLERHPGTSEPADSPAQRRPAAPIA